MDSGCEAQLSISPERVEKAQGEIKKTIDGKEARLAQMRKLEGKLNFAQTSVMGKVGRAAMRPLFYRIVRGRR